MRVAHAFRTHPVCFIWYNVCYILCRPILAQVWHKFRRKIVNTCQFKGVNMSCTQPRIHSQAWLRGRWQVGTCHFSKRCACHLHFRYGQTNNVPNKTPYQTWLPPSAPCTFAPIHIQFKIAKAWQRAGDAYSGG